MSEEKLKELADSIFNKLNDEEKLYLLIVNNEKNKIIERLNKENCNLKGDYKRHIDRINELTNRIDKAIEYIEKTRNTLLLSYPPKEAFDIDKLLDILKGSDKE